MHNPYDKRVPIYLVNLYADRPLVMPDGSTPDHQCSGKQSLSASQQWVFTLTVGYRSHTPNPSTAWPRPPLFLPRTPPLTLHQSPGNGSPPVFIPRLYTVCKRADDRYNLFL